MKLKHKISVIITIILVFTGGVNYWRVRSAVVPEVEKGIQEKLDNTLKTYQAFSNARMQLLSALAKGMVEDSRLKAAMDEMDVPTLGDLLNDKLLEIDGDFLVVCGLKEQLPFSIVELLKDPVLHSTKTYKGKFLKTVDPAWLFKKSLEGEPYGAILYENYLLQTITVPITRGGFEVIGLLTIGFHVGQEFVENIKKITQSEVIIFGLDRVFSTTMAPQPPDSSPNLIEQISSLQIKINESEAKSANTDENFQKYKSLLGALVKWNLKFLNNKMGDSSNLLFNKETGDRWIFESKPLILLGEKEGGVVLYLLQNYDGALQFFRFLTASLTKTALVLLLIGVGFAVYFSGTLTHPLQALSNAMVKVREGDLEQQVQPTTSDEVAQLTGDFNLMVQGLKEKQTMSKFVSQSALDEIKSMAEGGRSELEMGGKRVLLTVLFSDIRSFTTLTESQSPEETVHMLNEYFNQMNSIALKHGGDIDKFIGDALMAVFKSSNPEEGAKGATMAALEMIETLKEWNEVRVSKNLPKILIGVGVNTGEVIQGNMGSQQRMEHTVIGDSVNLASRLEGLSKNGVHTHIVISEFTLAYVKDMVDTVKMESQAVKGKSQIVEMYEVVGLKG